MNGLMLSTGTVSFWTNITMVPGAIMPRNSMMRRMNTNRRLQQVLDYYDENVMPLTTNAYLYLSRTPFRAINSGEFIEEQIYNWTYSDEQRAKEEWQGEHNPYLSLPRMVLLTYQMPDSLRAVALQGASHEFAP